MRGAAGSGSTALRVLGAAAVGALAIASAGCGGSSSPTSSTTATSSTSSIASAGSTSAGVTTSASGEPSSCDAWGSTFVKRFNEKAVAQKNPERMLSACCAATTTAGVHHCFIRITLVGTKSLGCESVDLGENLLPVGPGRRERCATHL